MASCPKCGGAGGFWVYCKACGKYFCERCTRKELNWSMVNVCPFCGVYNKLEHRDPS